MCTGDPQRAAVRGQRGQHRQLVDHARDFGRHHLGLADAAARYRERAHRFAVLGRCRRLYLDPAVAGKAFPEAPSPGAASGKPEGIEDLSPREREVLRLTAQGFANKEIAGRLEVSVKTVETYKARGAEKLGLRTRAEIVRYGAAQGWLDQLEEP